MITFSGEGLNLFIGLSCAHIVNQISAIFKYNEVYFALPFYQRLSD